MVGQLISCRACGRRRAYLSPEHRGYALTALERENGKLICTGVSRALTPELVARRHFGPYAATPGAD